ncbi:MAG: bacillithiol system redox-active protein YtxJ [Flavobacteriaceae bacterium]|nr:bacillithiol system redox-active protein YtxJ [Bacteroidia bacterium]NNK87316.1 bacillithiol system redox-active protein YtxJ [Flavobacteriaceae bacterium]
MGIFKKFINTTKSSIKFELPWEELTDTVQIDAIVTKSTDRAQIVFKHSTRCGISGMVLNGFEKAYDIPEDKADIYLLDLISYRQLSSAIEDRFGIVHESPQVLVIKKGQVIAHGSHGRILDLDIKELLK